jgi:hypothetical protein
MKSSVSVWDCNGTGIVMELEFSSQIFEKISDTKINENPYSWSRFVP